MCAEYSPADEYNTLRAELLEGKRYVFERPLLIVTVTLAGLNFVDKAYVAYLPPVAIGLMMFNLWFTVNRARSIARIVAYIQIELEEKTWRPWLGWETCLRHYRTWVKQNSGQQHKMVEDRIDRETVPDAIGYYSMIFIMHVAAVVLLLVASLLSVFRKPEMQTIILFAVTLLSFIWFSIAAAKWRPIRCKNLIEEDRVRWELVFEYLEAKGIRKKQDQATT